MYFAVKSTDFFLLQCTNNDKGCKHESDRVTCYEIVTIYLNEGRNDENMMCYCDSKSMLFDNVQSSSSLV